MRQYGALKGNPWDSERDFLAAKARAVEDRVADEDIAAGLEDWELEIKPCGVPGCEVCDLGPSDRPPNLPL